MPGTEPLSPQERGPHLHAQASGHARIYQAERDLFVSERDLHLHYPAENSVPCTLEARDPYFVGREKIFQQLDSSLPAGADHRPATPLLLITGPGGVGKTATANEWAHRVREYFPDGQIFIDLCGYDTRPPVPPTQALVHLLEALGIKQNSTDIRILANRYRTALAARRILIILDNVAGKEQVHPLLPSGVNCLTIVTSRSQIGEVVVRHGARRIFMTPLNHREAQSLLTATIGKPRNRAIAREYSELATLTGFLPLALRIVAAYLTSAGAMTIADYVSELHSGDRLEKIGSRGGPDDELRSVIAMSYNNLPEGAQVLFRRLADFPGPHFTTEAVAALMACDARTARRLLGFLSDLHLVESPRASRFTLHDLVRLLALHLADEMDNNMDRVAALHRLGWWYVKTTNAAVRRLMPTMVGLPEPELDLTPLSFSTARDAADWLAEERLNVLATAEKLALPGAAYDGRLVCHLADSLRRSSWSHPHGLLWTSVAQAAHAATRRQGDAAEASAYLALGASHAGIRRFSEAVSYYAEAATRYHDLEDLAGEAAALHFMAYLSLRHGSVEVAADQVRRAIDLRDHLGDEHGCISALSNLSTIEAMLGRLEDSERLAHEVADGAARLDYLTAAIHANNALGFIHRQYGRLRTALQYYTEAQKVAEPRDDHYRLSEALAGQAGVNCDASRASAAERLAKKALRSARTSGNQIAEIDSLIALGNARILLSDTTSAKLYHTEALELAVASNCPYQQANALLGLSGVRQTSEESVNEATRALDLLQKNHLKIGMGYALAALGNIIGVYDPGSGLTFYRRACAIFESTGQRLGEARAFASLASLQECLGEASSARESREDSLRILTDLDSETFGP